ncbi:MAG: hypothetical protein ACRYG6_04850 [Janthinobacterium lividum]
MLTLSNFHYAAMDFAIDIASLADWNFHHRAKTNPAWLRFKPKDRLSEFTRHVAAKSEAIAALTDLANEMKHADRHSPSKHLAELAVYFAEDESVLNRHPEWIKNAIAQRSSTGIINIPCVVLADGRRWLYKPLAVGALNWWSSFDPMAPVT